jgi:hypothetical protein
MVDSNQQRTMMKKVETLFHRLDRTEPIQIEERLRELGFVERGADPAVILLIHPELNLYLDILLDEEGLIHGYELVPEEEWEKKQEKFRW